MCLCAVKIVEINFLLVFFVPNILFTFFLSEKRLILHDATVHYVKYGKSGENVRKYEMKFKMFSVIIFVLENWSLIFETIVYIFYFADN